MEYATNWGYSVDLPQGCFELPPIISVDEFIEQTDGKMVSSEARIEAVIGYTSQAIRDWCGWHVAPALPCSWVGEGDGRLMLLPCKAVTSVTSLKVLGSDEGSFEWKPNGLLRLKGSRFPDEWRSVEVAFTAGFEAIGSLKQAVLQIASNALAATPGVRGERVGQVSVDFNQTASGVSGGVRFLESDLGLLAPYRLSVR